MRAGLLRHRVKVQTPTEITSPGGERSQSWGDITTIWARVRPATAREVEVGEKSNLRITHMVEVRWQDNMFLPENRFLFGSRALEIIGARNGEERDIFGLIECVEVEL